MSWLAITRGVSSRLADCELTHQSRVPLDVGVARRQHAGYVDCLKSVGCEVVQLPALDAFPDSVFVEDAALVLDEAALLLRPGAVSRRGEVASITEVLSTHREIVHSIREPGTMDGGDVLVVGRRIFVGRSSRTNGAAIQQLRDLVRPWDYGVEVVEVASCLHLKSAATAVDENTVLLDRRWVEFDVFAGLRRIEIDPNETGAANVVSVGSELIYSSAFPRTRERLERDGHRVHTVDVTELAKAEGAVTCCSLLVRRA